MKKIKELAGVASVACGIMFMTAEPFGWLNIVGVVLFGVPSLILIHNQNKRDE